MNSYRWFVLRRPFSSLLLLMALLITVLAWQNRVALRVFPSIISAYTAKEYCSCRYVTGNPADYCAVYVKQYVPSSLVDDVENKRVTASCLGHSSSAAWQSPHQGCQLDP